MYENYWQLENKPFESSVEERFYYPSESHQGAALKLRYAIENRRGAALLAGPAGTGKTLLVNSLRRQLPESFKPFAHLVFPQFTARELLAFVADRLGAPLPEGPRYTTDESVRRIEQLLEQNTREGRHAVLALDEAQLLDECETLDTVRLLLNFEWDSQPGLTLLLVGQPALIPVLERMPSLEERLAVKVLLRSYTLEETVSYVNHRLTGAGATRTIFEDTAVEAIHYQSGGVPRQINRLGDLCLLIGYAEGITSVSADQVQSVAQELVNIAPE